MACVEWVREGREGPHKQFMHKSPPSRKHWGQRTVDIDLIAFGQNVLPNSETFKQWQLLPFSQQAKVAPDQLILPHPRMQDRAFVLGPMMDICPAWVHPVIQKSASQMYDVLDRQDKAEVMPL